MLNDKAHLRHKAALTMKPLKLAAALTAGLILNSVPAAVLAQANPYSTNARSTFLTGCLLEDPPDFENGNEVYLRLQLCVCILDQFQDTYTEAQFAALFQGASEDNPEQQEELSRFVEQNISACF